jgi:hypothetical protein
VTRSPITPPTSKLMNKYFELLILALVIPSVMIIVFSIFIVGRQLDPGDSAYLLLLFALFIPAGGCIVSSQEFTEGLFDLRANVSPASLQVMSARGYATSLTSSGCVFESH